MTVPTNDKRRRLPVAPSVTPPKMQALHPSSRIQVMCSLPWCFIVLLLLSGPFSSLCGVRALSASQRRTHTNSRSPSSQPTQINNPFLSSSASIHTRRKNKRRAHPLCRAATTTYDNDSSSSSILDDEFRIQKQTTMEFIRNNKIRGAFQSLREMVALAEAQTAAEGQLLKASKEVDHVFEAFTSRAFLPPYQGNAARNRVKLGMDALKLQLSSQLAPPYDRVEKRVYLKALRALTGLNEVQQQPARKGSTEGGNPFSSSFGFDSNYSSFRILQRLLTGAGIRRKNSDTNKYTNGSIQEKDFNMVLNSFSNIGRMDMAHKIVALQERTENAPPLSPVAYSILLKGYGRLGDLRNVNMIISHAEADGIVPDTVMLNSLMDAYINCNAVGKARGVFNHMTMQRDDSGDDKDVFYWTGSGSEPQPQANRRTYNTMLKGLAKTGSLQECLVLSQEMEQKGLWDDVTTNTLVHAAVVLRDFSTAQALLDRYTATVRDSGRGRHPNVEAYTELLDGYSKAGELDMAVQVMKTMKDRGIEPNEVTYTCLIAAFARHKKVDQAKKMLHYMESTGLKPSAVTFNAFISALVSNPEQDDAAVLTDEQVSEALNAFYKMMKSGIRPNDVTISVLILALGRCHPAPRVEEAKALVAKLEANGIVSAPNNQKVATALIRVCRLAGDMDGALEAFQKLRKPDLVAVNTFLDACARCSSDPVVAVKTFRHYFGGENITSTRLEPDVISYSILICALLKQDTNGSSKEAERFYDEMKNARCIAPDKAMVDLVLKTIIRTGRLRKKDIHLVASVVRDAEKLNWRPDQLERRKRAIQAVLSSRSRVWVDDDADDDMLRQEIKSEDALFKRKGWNEVDSGFRLWGGGRMDMKLPEKSTGKGVDKFLESKGWNNVDSGFRII